MAAAMANDPRNSEGWRVGGAEGQRHAFTHRKNTDGVDGQLVNLSVTHLDGEGCG